MKGIILHGEKLRHGQLTPDIKKRIASLLTLIENDKYDVLVITGGKTNHAISQSEAELIFNDIKHLVKMKVLLEDKSKTTVQNIKNTREILELSSYDSFTIITNKCSVRRFKRLYKLYLPEYFDRLTFEYADNTHNLASFFAEAFMYAYYLFDPHEVLLKPVIKLMR